MMALTKSAGSASKARRAHRFAGAGELIDLDPQLLEPRGGEREPRIVAIDGSDSVNPDTHPGYPASVVVCGCRRRGGTGLVAVLVRRPAVYGAGKWRHIDG
jgi:hypothetical protein